MEPLTTQQELLVSDNQNYRHEEHEDEDKQIKLNNIIDPENETGINRDFPLFPEKNKFGDDTIPLSVENDGYASISTDAPLTPPQEKLPDQSDVNDNLVNSKSSLISDLLPESEVASGDTYSTSSLDSSVVDSTHVPKQNMVSDHTTYEGLKDFMADQKKDVPLEDANSNLSYQSSITDHFANNYVETTVEAQLLSENEISEVATVGEEAHEQGRMPEVSVKGNNSAVELHTPGHANEFGTVSMSAPVHTFADEQVKNGHTEITVDQSQSISESPSSSNIFSSAGIPAPSVVSEALRVTPGKILVQPVVDQVQGQALAALQAMKVFVRTNHG